jgi:hypothetical protein
VRQVFLVHLGHVHVEACRLSVSERA